MKWREPVTLLPVSGPITRADINALIEDNLPETEAADIADIADQVSASANAVNWLRNPDFRSWTIGTSVSLPFATWTPQADAWEASATYTDGINPGTGASPAPTTFITYSRADDAVHNHVLYCAKFLGEPNGASVRFGQKLSGQVAAGMLENEATLTIEVENKTGASQTVWLYFDSCDTFENYGATTNRYSANLGAIANNTRTTLTHTLDLSAFATHVRKGGRIYVKLSGLDGNSKEWRVYHSRLEPGPTATPRRIERDPIAATASEPGADVREFLRNGDFSQWLAATATCPEDITTHVAEGWGAVPTDGSTLVYARVVDSPDVLTLYGAELTGHADVSTTVDFVQDIPRHVAAELRGEVVFSIYIYNGTGTSFEPDFRLDTCDAENSSARTNRIAQPLDLCANAAWTRVEWAFDGSLLTNMANGCRLGIRVPSGSLDNVSKSVTFAQASLRYGSTAAAFAAEPVRAGTQAVRDTAAGVKNLRMSKASATTLSVAAAAATAANDDGHVMPIRNLSATVNIATTGANALDLGTATLNKWYLVYLITNGEQSAALLHREDDADGPLALPAGYHWRTEPVGAIFLTAAAEVPDIYQVGQWQVIPLAAVRTTAVAVQDVWEQITQANVAVAAPELAIAVRGTIGISNNSAGRIALSPKGSTVGQLNFACANAAVLWEGFQGGATPYEMTLAGTQEMWIMADTTGMTPRITISAFQVP